MIILNKGDLELPLLGLLGVFYTIFWTFSLWNCSSIYLWTIFIASEKNPYAFSLASNKSWLSVSEALDRFKNIVSSFLHLSRVLMVIIARLECDLVYPDIFLFYILHARAIESAEFREFQLPTIFQIQWKNLLWMDSLL